MQRVRNRVAVRLFMASLPPDQERPSMSVLQAVGARCFCFFRLARKASFLWPDIVFLMNGRHARGARPGKTDLVAAVDSRATTCLNTRGLGSAQPLPHNMRARHLPE